MFVKLQLSVKNGRIQSGVTFYSSEEVVGDDPKSEQSRPEVREGRRHGKEPPYPEEVIQPPHPKASPKHTLPVKREIQELYSSDR